MHRDEYPPSAAPEKAEPFIDNTSDGVPMDKHSEEKQHPSRTCTKHDPNSTARLDTYLTQRTAHAAAHSLTPLAHDAVDGQHCTRCTANEAARTLTRFLFEARKGKMGEEERKALKVEVKGMMREVKAVVREEKGRLKREGGGR